MHATRWDAASQADPLLDEQRWRQTAEPLPVPGQVNLLRPSLVVVGVLYGLQQRFAAQGTSYCRFLPETTGGRTARPRANTTASPPRAPDPAGQI